MDRRRESRSRISRIPACHDLFPFVTRSACIGGCARMEISRRVPNGPGVSGRQASLSFNPLKMQ